MTTVNDSAEGVLTYYVGPRPIVFGDNTKDWVNTYTGKVGVYSNWSLMSSHVTPLEYMPDNQYTLGTRKHARILEYIYAGKPHIAPMDNAGGGTRLSYHRTHPFEYKGTVPAFPSGYGHAVRTLYYSVYNNYVFDGVTSADVMLNSGHARRFNTTYGGAFDPYIFKGAPSSLAMTNVGQALPATAMTSNYGHNKINEWRGTPSSKAL
jgi:hypothetical protein